MKFYAKGVYCPKVDCNTICLTCDNANDILNLGHVTEGRRFTGPLDVLGNTIVDLEQYKRLNEIKEDAFKWVKGGGNLFIYSKTTGNGKSTWANKIFLQFVFMYAELMAIKNKVELHSCIVRWANVAETLEEFRKDYAGKSFDEGLGKDLNDSKLVVWDDLGSEVSSKWVIEKLYIHINHRLESNKSNIITSNLSPDELLEQGYINQRLHSRLKVFEIVEFLGVDRRTV